MGGLSDRSSAPVSRAGTEGGWVTGMMMKPALFAILSLHKSQILSSTVCVSQNLHLAMSSGGLPCATEQKSTLKSADTDVDHNRVLFQGRQTLQLPSQLLHGLPGLHSMHDGHEQPSLQ